MTSSERTCNRCLKRKPLAEYRAQEVRGVLYYRGRCNPCEAAWTREHRKQNPEAARAYRKTEKAKTYNRGRMLEVRYGLSLDDFEALKTSQGGCCAICTRPADKPLHVDHDHATGEVRGLLCATCNRGVGLFYDDPALMRAAAAYLSRPRLLKKSA